MIKTIELYFTEGEAAIFNCHNTDGFSVISPEGTIDLGMYGSGRA
jgi:hypothetical protein